jgi:hypothetical protein
MEWVSNKGLQNREVDGIRFAGEAASLAPLAVCCLEALLLSWFDPAELLEQLFY